MSIETTYGDKLIARENQQNPVKQQAEQIKAKVYDQRVTDFKVKGSQEMRGMELGMQDQHINWEMAATEGADFSSGVPYKYMTANAPERYLWGVDMATGHPAQTESDIETLISAAPPEASTFWDVAKAIPYGGVHGVINAVRTVRDNISPFSPVDIHDDKMRELIIATGQDPEAFLELPLDIRKAYLRLAYEPELAELVDATKAETTAGGITHSMVNFLMYAIPMTRLAGATGLGPVGADIAGGAAASTVAWEHGEPTLFNLMANLDNPMLNNAVTQYLSSSPEDSWAEDKVKQALTDALMNVGMRGAFGAVMRGIKSVRHSPWAKMAAKELDGYLKLANMHKTRGSFSLAPARAADPLEAEAWSQIIAGKIAKGQITKKQFMEGGSSTFDQETLDTIWSRAKGMSTEVRTQVRRLLGAPPRIKNVQLRQDMVDVLSHTMQVNKDKLAEAAAWWDTSAGAIKELAGGDDELQEKLLRLFAMYGQDSTVGANVTAVLQSMDEIAKGTMSAHGRYPGRLAENLDRLLDTTQPWSIDTPGVNNKLLNYYQNLSDAARGTDVAPDAVTVDVWMQRLLGYKNLPVGPQYEWSAQMVRDVANSVNNTLGTSYKPREMQTMLWQFSKNVWTKQARTGDVETFSKALARRTSILPWEAVPAPETGRLANFYDWPVVKQRQFNEWSSNIVKNADGTDQIAEKVGVGTLRYNETAALGTWENNFSPNRVGKLRDPGAVKQFDPVQSELMTLMRQYIYRQHGAMWWKPNPSGATDAMMFKMRGTPTEAMLKKVYKAIKKVDSKAEGTFIEGEFHFLNVAETEEFVKRMRTVLDDPELAGMFDNPGSGAYKTEVYWYEHDWKADPRGDAILGEIAARGRRDLLPWLRDKAREFDALTEAVEGNLEQLGKEADPFGR
jgi:hypothetical protein